MLMKAYHQTIWNEVAVDYFCMTLMVGEVFLLSMSFYMVKHFLFHQCVIGSKYIPAFNLICGGIVIILTIRNILACSKKNKHIWTLKNKCYYIYSGLLCGRGFIIDRMLAPYFDIEFPLGYYNGILFWTLLNAVSGMIGVCFISFALAAILYFCSFPAPMNLSNLLGGIRKNIFIDIIRLILVILSFLCVWLSLRFIYLGRLFEGAMFIFGVYVFLSISASISMRLKDKSGKLA